ncbi:MAG TPA: dihydroorotate dehydrogenase [Clostridiales bacterium]|nr:dihydroorotate dehydrogenase [Clostridiales bacterium]
MVDLSTNIGCVRLANPILAASGTFGFGREMSLFQDLSGLGGICAKGLTLLPRIGNPPPRVAETASGLLNSVGLQNPGLEAFLREDLPFLQTLGCRIIVNIAGHSTDEYLEICRRLDQTPVDAIELNLSCPNVKEGCMLIGSNARLTERLVAEVRKVTAKPLWAKLTPNVTSITDMAASAEAGGADAVVLINTLLGLAIDYRTRRPVLRNNTGGLSGPAIKPVALRMVAEAYRAVRIPIIGIGGIMNGADVLEFLIAGASAVEIGTANLISPTACHDILNQVKNLAETEGIARISDYTGTLELWNP